MTVPLDPRLLQLATDQHSVITVDQARRSGVSDDDLRSLVGDGVLEKRAPGVLVVADAAHTPEQRLLIATWACGPTAVLSHSSAAWMWHLDGANLSDMPEVTVVRPSRGNRQLAVVHETRSMDDVDRTALSRIPITSVARTLIDLAAVLELDALERAVDGALRDNLVTRNYLNWRLQELRTSGRKGLATLDRILHSDERQPQPPTTWLQTSMLRLLARSGLPEPVVTHSPAVHKGEVDRVVFTFGEGQLTVEATSKPVDRLDTTRAEFGAMTLRFTSADITDHPSRVIDEIRAASVALGIITARPA